MSFVLILATLLSYGLGALLGVPALVPILNTAASVPFMIQALRRGDLQLAVARMLVWALTMGVSATLWSYARPAQTGALFLRGEAYRVEMFAWVLTGRGAESTPSQFIPEQAAHAAICMRVSKVLDLLLKVEEERLKRVTTSQVNTTLEALVARRQPPQAAGREVKLMYATQVETAPPTIAVFGNHPELLEEHYVRYLHNGFRDAYGFTGNPLRIVLRRRAA